MDAEATRDTLRFARSTGKIKARDGYIDVNSMLKKGVDTITTSIKYFCKDSIKHADRESTVPDIGGLAGKSLADLATLKPKTIHFRWDIGVFGFEMSDGTKIIGGDEDYANNRVTLPR